MQTSTNLGLNLPELGDQYDLNHWNENTNKLDGIIHGVQEDITPITNEEIDTIMEQ